MTKLLHDSCYLCGESITLHSNKHKKVMLEGELRLVCLFCYKKIDFYDDKFAKTIPVREKGESMKLSIWFLGILLICQVAMAFDFTSTELINSATTFKGNGMAAYQDTTNISNGFNISAIFKLDEVHHEYIIWSKDRYLLQVTVDGYIQSGLYANSSWYPLVTYPTKAEVNKPYEVFFSYNNSDVMMVVNGYSRTAKFGSPIIKTKTITYIGNRDDWSRDLHGTISYLKVTPYPLVISPSIPPITPPAEVCGDGNCSKTENKDNCPSDCGAQVGARNLNKLYHTKNETIRLWKELVDTHPTLGSYESIGKSIQGNDIWLFMFGNPNGGRVMIDSQGHGIEDCGNEIGYTFVKWLLDSNSSEAQRIIKENYVMFIPSLNIDAYRRQNMRSYYTLPNGSILNVSYGVDLNRNGLSGFGGSGSSNPTNNYEYRGLSAGSEPETQALAFAEQKYHPDIYVNTHCGMNMLHYCTNNNITKAIIAQIQNVSPATINKYGYGSQCSGGYIMTQASSYGANSWIFEIATWNELPNNVSDFNNKFYPLAAPVFKAMCNSVGRT